MKTTDHIFRDAQTLAMFANLEPAGVEEFRNNYAGYLPEVWWKWNAPVAGEEKRKLWVEKRNNLREAWRTGFPLEATVRLISSAAIPDNYASAVKFSDERAEPNFLAPNAVVVQAAHPFVMEIDPDLWIKATKVWPFQQAVMFLGTNPWRASSCVCGQLFVMDKPAQRYCSDKCFQDARKLAKRVWWSEHGEAVRSGKRKPTKKHSKKRKG